MREKGTKWQQKVRWHTGFKKEGVVLYVHVQASQLAIDYMGNQAR